MKKEGLANILHIAQMLSKELSFDTLLQRMVEVCLTYTEAQHCLILENQEGKLLIQAEGHEGNPLVEVMQSVPIESRGRIRKTFILSQKLPLFVIDAVVKSQQELLITDFSPYQEDQYVQNFHPEAILAVPIIFEGYLKAIVYLESRKANNAFSVDTEEFMAILAEHFAIYMRNAKLHFQSNKEVDELGKELALAQSRNEQFQQNVQLLGEIGQDIAANFTIKEIIASVYENVNTLMDASLFSIGIYNPDTDAIDMPATIERDQQLDAHSYSLEEKERLAVWCFLEKKEVFINDFKIEYPRYFPNARPVDPKVGDLPDSVIYLPILTQDEPIGVITVQSFRRYAYSDFHLSMLRNLAVYVAIALENMHSYQQVQESKQMLATQKALIEKQKEQVTHAYQDIQVLAELGREITTNLDIKRIVEAAQKNINTIMDASIFTIGIHNKKNKTLEMPLTIEHGEKIEYHEYDLTKDEPRLATWCFKKSREVFIHDYIEEFSSYFPNTPLAMPKVGQLPQSVIYIPIKNQTATIGVLTVQSFEKAAYTEYHLNFLRNMGVYIGIAIENAEAYEHIKERNEAIAEQKQLIEQSFSHIKLLGEVGQEITSNLDTEHIISTVYDNVNSMMDAPIISIGLFNKKNHSLDMPGNIENDKVLPFHSYSLDDEDKLAVICFKELKEVIINDLYEEYKLYIPRVPMPKAELGELPESIVYLPLIGKDKTVGVFSVQSFIKGAYGEQEMNFLRNLAIYVAIALENAEAYQQIEDKNAEVAKQRNLIEEAYQNMKLLADMGQDIMASLEVHKIIETVYENINTIVDASVFWIGIYNEDNNTLEFKGGKEKGITFPDFEVAIDKEERLATWCFLQQAEVFINDMEQEYTNYLPEQQDALIGENPESIIYLPLTVKGKRMGVLTVQSFQPNAYKTHHLEILRNLVNYVFTALENALLYATMEDEVRERTAQVVLQKEELELQRDQIEQSFQTVKLLSQIGQSITGLLYTDQIIRTVYDNVNNLMDATTFGIGLLNKDKSEIIFRGAIEEGKTLPEFHHDAYDEQRFSVWALKHNEEVFINDFVNDYKKYIPSMKKAAAGGESSSIMYLPLNTSEGQIGVITVQSFENDAYTQYHLDILKNLAVYVAIAIQNAESYHEIEQQTEEIEKANLKLTSSINYAKRIQQAILPNVQTIQEVLPELFVLFRPRDIVSGDFYWFREQHRKFFLASMDCTGHGVPGAFMSMVGNDLLNEIITYLNFSDPDYILSELHTGVREALRQDETDSRDGMDIGICVIDPYNKRIEFAGAKQDLVFVRNGELHIVEGDRHSVGGHQRESYRSFTRHKIDVQQGDVFYMFSDGFQDQFGGSQGRKFLSRRFKQLLLDIHQEPMPQQEALLEQELLEWMGFERQIDDVMVIGFKVG